MQVGASLGSISVQTDPHIQGPSLPWVLTGLEQSPRPHILSSHICPLESH